MTRFAKGVCVVLCLCFFGVLAVMPEPFSSLENIYRQLPLYRYLEEQAEREEKREDGETADLIVKRNGDYLAEQVRAENTKATEETAEDEAAASFDGTAESADAASVLGDADIPLATDSEADSSREKQTDSETVGGTEAVGEPEADGEVQAGTEAEELAGAESQIESEPQVDTAETETGRETEIAVETQTDLQTGEPTETKPQTAEPGQSESEPETGQEAGIEAEPQTEPETQAEQASVLIAAEPNPTLDLSIENLSDLDFVLRNFYVADANTTADAAPIDAVKFLSEDLTMKQDASLPQILIYHSHSQESFADSREGETEDTVVGVGNYLAELLTKNYGYNVLHVTETFDIIDGVLDRSGAYDNARQYIEQVLEANPSIEVVIDLHRDGVPEGRRLVTEINGKDTAQIMFFNGLSYTLSEGEVTYLPNPYIEDNLAFSFQLEYQAALYYPEFYRCIYLAGLRYNLHLRPKALLLEAGAQTNTVQEVKNAMEPFADILNKVLQG